MSEIRRFIEQDGQDWTIRYWTLGADDAYKDSTKTLGASSTFKALRSEPKNTVNMMLTYRGEEREVRTQLIVLTGAVNADAIEDTRNDPPVVTSPTGETYDVVAVGREGETIMGTQRLFLSKRRSGS